MNRKQITRMVVLSLVGLTIFGSLLTTQAVAQTNESKPQARVESNLPVLLAETIAQGLAAQGYKVERNGTSVSVATPVGQLILDLPATQEALERGEITVTVDGLTLHADRFTSPDMSELYAKGGIGDTVSCILAAVDIYGTCLDICEFSSSGIDILCPVECTFKLTLNVLRCVFGGL